jgi:hypothetical protein
VRSKLSAICPGKSNLSQFGGIPSFYSFKLLLAKLSNLSQFVPICPGSVGTNWLDCKGGFSALSFIYTYIYIVFLVCSIVLRGEGFFMVGNLSHCPGFVYLSGIYPLSRGVGLTGVFLGGVYRDKLTCNERKSI